MPQRLPRPLVQALLSACLLCAAPLAFGAPSVFMDTRAAAGGCPFVDNNPPSFIVTSGPELLERHTQTARAESSYGSMSRSRASASMGRVYPFHVFARSPVQPPDCGVAFGETTSEVGFSDAILVTAGDLPAGTLVNYTATVEVPVEINLGAGACVGRAMYRGYLSIGNKSRIPYELFMKNTQFSGIARMSLTLPVEVGDTLTLTHSVIAYAATQQYRDSDNQDCDAASVRMTDVARIRLTADVPGANMVSVNGIRYGRMH